MMMRQLKLGVSFYVTLKTSSGIFARIKNKFAATTSSLDVQTSRSVTGFAT